MADTRLARLNGEWRRVPRALEFAEFARQRVGLRRYQHTISVTQTLYVIAQDLELSSTSAVAAGLLHDSCKGLKNDVMLAEADRYGIPVTDLQRERPSLLHGHVAAEVCRIELALDDADAFEAIYWHVTGRPGLGLLGRALFLADFSEPLRNHPASAAAREVYDAQGFDAALVYAAEAKMTFVENKGVTVDPRTRAFHEWLLADVPS
ncbi:MAG: bis(5'-nucleosyl)-tetraphosphatase (symmetrical) YqeK [Candidatus Hydrogenedentes bacterium]|nr:bis(5'-nucleosyl)-tetraphosphatase (symmetrical) YqeK [Candidatus Hydrogenedentota bacterium]